LQLQRLGKFTALRWQCVSLILLFGGFLYAGRQVVAAATHGGARADCRTDSDSSPFQPGRALVYTCEIIKTYPHDPEAFTQGLFIDRGYLYESTGLYGRSSIRKVELETGKIISSKSLPAHLFGEGLARWKDTLIQLTWQSQLGLVYDAANLETLRTFNYRGEGWGLTEDGEFLIVSDGSAILRFWDPANFEEVRRIEVSDHGTPVKCLNELEYIKGELFANIWHTDLIARISLETGEVLGWVDLAGVRGALQSDRKAGVLNGIAYDALQDRIFITGKFWPYLFEIRLVGPLVDP